MLYIQLIYICKKNNLSRVKVQLKSYLFLCSLVGYDVVITTYQTVGMEGNACDNEDKEVWLNGTCSHVRDTEGWSSVMRIRIPHHHHPPKLFISCSAGKSCYISYSPDYTST